MTVAYPAALLDPEVAQVPLIVDDVFYEYSREHSLPDCSVSFLMRAGSWSARNSRSGFVPSSMLASFSDDSDLVTRTLLAAGLIERARGGVRIAEGRGLAVINAADAEAVENAPPNRTSLSEKRTSHSPNRTSHSDRIRSHGKSAGGKRGNHGRWHESRGIRVPGCEYCLAMPPEEEGIKRTSHSPNRTSHETKRTSHSDPGSDDLDLDFDQSAQVDQVSQSSRRNARARENSPAPGTPAFRLQVITAMAAATGTEISDATADAIAADVLGSATDPVPHKLAYVLKSIANERDPRARWLPKPAVPARTRFADPPPWCGDRWCSQKTHRREDPDTGADLGPCPNCGTREVS
jgi:hypothetical protein